MPSTLPICVSRVRLGGASDPEVGDLDRASSAEEEVAGLDVAVYETGRVRVLESGADLDAEVDDACGVEPLLEVELVRERAAVHVLHDDVRVAVVLARVVDLDDVGVGESRREARLADEAVAEDGVIGQVAGEHLDRHRPVELVVPRKVDDGHAPAAEHVGDAVAPAASVCVLNRFPP